MTKSGKTLLRLPISLHGRLSRDAAREHVSLNQYLLMLLSMNRPQLDPSYETFRFDGCMEKNDGTIFTQEEADQLLDSFLEWAESHGCGFGGSLGVPTRDLEEE